MMLLRFAASSVTHFALAIADQAANVENIMCSRNQQYD
jgi:hypothetical protein